MLVFISDIHLTDGTSGETINQRAFKVFRERLRDLAYDASWRADGKYRPIERLDLVFLGDILDVIRSTKWLEGSVRPWGNWKSAQFRGKVDAVTQAILNRNGEALGYLKSMQDPKVITIPEATKAGAPKKVSRDPDAKYRVPVQVRLHYMAGNHDWFYHLPGDAYDAIRKGVVDAMGLANVASEPFPHRPEESAELRELFEKHQVLARHGDIFDPWNFEGDRDGSSLGDAIVVELLNRFPAEVERQLGGSLPAKCHRGLREIDNVRPLLVIPAWIDGLLQRLCPDPAQTKRVKRVWDDLADEFLKLDFVKSHDKWYELADLTDKLELALKFSRGVSIRSLDRLLGLWGKLFPGEKPFYRNALGEQGFKNRSARFVVYGHTHRHEIVPLDACVREHQPLNQMYVNAGTWRRVHERAVWKPEEQEFLGYYTMTYVAFFSDGERGGRAFETWSGTLGG